MHEVQTFLRQAWAEAESARIAKERADQEDEAEALQKKRNAKSIEYAGSGAGIGGLLGAIVIGLAGCVSCFSNITPKNLIADFNLFSGAFYGAFGGALIGAIIGVLIGQSEN